ncbi:hypothetical protein A2767_07225 [Candidatus Roizmanbacteria bacterium RIFCSPHIGHO2_01_FULL_35_10]|uniref:Uncharacterized protein n=1 Tax=Candidatus Roizmanbacteria bacterium RIFCSPLOWO2_01_FULL_35_13 TaxID=1802055 RepID=A0A1F7I814_9BACT|nr:MAG: hypothetical protein A2767_07225 [Candidatus Roizmanbacteria bacterium RIFCSPHIGHO2_01_FULL_35_10]OGK39508.1 MAG: hypothetical protein A3A74_00615 [Candidatus Roizmanbacteria bacterium RIFCSPLOWO2_01_FULL_35_13]
MLVILNSKATTKDIKTASEDYESFIKITIDIVKEKVIIGGEYHYDAEQELLRMGSKQEDILGGGFNLDTKVFATNALINMKPKYNSSAEILNEKKRIIFLKIAKKYLDVLFK